MANIIRVKIIEYTGTTEPFLMLILIHYSGIR